MSIVIHPIDYSEVKYEADFIYMLDHYAQSEMGGGKALPESVKQTLFSNLSNHPTALSLLAYDGKQPVGLLNAFESFSTFANEPLINIHDVIVLEGHRGRGIGQQLLGVIEEIAKSRGCCKITLEVLSGNEMAKSAYSKAGFSGYSLDDNMGEALFWQKVIS